MSGDKEKARELAQEALLAYIGAGSKREELDALAEVMLSAMRYAYEEAAKFALERRVECGEDLKCEGGHVASIIRGEIDGYNSMIDFAESRARDLGGERG